MSQPEQLERHGSPVYDTPGRRRYVKRLTANEAPMYNRYRGWTG